ncbi:hypothetical protein [Planctomycetes bacterium TBK1r]|uniref:Secreted protein n=1 Tax=Stieleria magnilauensis TaxID=2527963 RepID=A0ABX5XVC6_9BACT|nr:hypothetical protein TBK1r_50050 [Planctomycetes bacterium TBK1r]
MRCMRSTFVLLCVLCSQTLASPAANAVDVLASAVLAPGDQLYGIATIELPLANPIIGQAPRPLTVSSDSGRVFYPVSEDVEARIVPPSERPVPQPGNGRLLGRLGNLLREITDKDAPTSQIVARRATFLFKGDTPLRVRVADGLGEVGEYELKPTRDATVYRVALARWWNTYAANAKEQIDAGDYPPWVESYLVAMLSGRTDNALPTWFTETKEQGDPLWATLEYLGGAETVTQEVFRRTAAGLTDVNLPAKQRHDAAAMVALPEGPKWKAPTLGPIDDSVVTEPIATRVPPECFYLRFGQFSNYLWFLDLAEEYGGDVGRMIKLRGTEVQSTAQFQRQISVKINQLSRTLGPTVVLDQAVIGRDLFTSDGASMGVILKSANAFLLRSSLSSDRSNRARGDEAVTLKTIKIAGRDVSFLSSADNSVRSFLAEDDGYFLITNSKTLVRRFFEVGQSGESLAATDSFRLSRSLVPTTRDDTIFAYFSPEMLQGLVSPQYLIELRRRSRAESDVALVHLARLAATAEGVTADGDWGLGVEELIETGFLPLSFGNRSDGSGVISVGDQVIDTLRGVRGTFVPIADIEIESVTRQEFDWYTRIANEYSERFPQIDPIIVALRREDIPGDDTLERISIHAEIAPLTPEKYGKWAKQLGPPTSVAMRFAPDDIVSVQAHVASAQIGPPTHLFAGIKDTFPPAPDQFDGILKTYWALRELPAYLGAWPQPGALDRLPLGLGRGRPVGPGMSKLLGGLYRYSGGGFSVLSFQPEILNATLPFLEATDVGQPATARGRVGSLLGSQLEGWVNNELYQNAAQASRAGAEFLNLFSEQLHVGPDEAIEQVTLVLGVPLQCPLGGQYEYDPIEKRWRSTAWSGNEPLATPPADYVAPLLNWFRGGRFTMTQYSDRLVADVEITVARGAGDGY